MKDVTHPARHIVRWVDRKGARQYVRHDQMIGRVRHWLPHEITGLDKIYHKTGLSFGIPGSRSHWNGHCDEGISFTVDRDELDNQVYEIDGHEIYLLSDAYDRRRLVAVPDLQDIRKRAVSASQKAPDEAFVVGNIREMHSKLVAIGIRNGVDKDTRAMIIAYAEKHDIPLEV